MRRFFFLFLLLLVCLPGPAPAARLIDIVADSYMPYTGDSEKGETGFMVDIAKAIWEKKGDVVTYQTMAWRDAVAKVRSGAATAIVGANKNDAPDFVFPKSEEAQALGVFFATSSGTWKYAGTESLEGIRLGVIADYHYNSEIEPYIQKNAADSKKIFQAVSSPDLLAQFVAHLQLGRIQSFIEDRYVMEYFLKNYPRRDSIVEAGTLKTPTNLYIAISPTVFEKDQLAQELDDGIAALRASGELSQILAKYGLSDWASSSPGTGASKP